MVAHLSFELLEVSATLRHPIARALVSTNFALVPGWNIPNWSTTFSLGTETSIVLQIQTLRAIDGCCYESEPWDAAGGWGEGGFRQHLIGNRLVAVYNGARDAVKFQETGRIGAHSCMGDLGRPPVDQGIRE